MSPWELLELPSDADKRSIKRAYAKKIKLYRPDESPEEFQQIRDAYEHCLEQLADKDALPQEHALDPFNAETADSTRHHGEQTPEYSEQVLQSFYHDFDQVLENLVNTEKMSDWHQAMWSALARHEALDILSLKAHLRMQVFDRLEMAFKRNFIRISYPYNLPEAFIIDVAEWFHFKDIEGQYDSPLMAVLDAHYYDGESDEMTYEDVEEWEEDTPSIQLAFKIFCAFLLLFVGAWVMIRFGQAIWPSGVFLVMGALFYLLYNYVIKPWLKK